MDTEKYCVPNEEMQVIWSDLLEGEAQVARDYVGITRHLQEINQLFLIFEYNTKIFQEHYSKRERKGMDVEKEYITINACVNNILSSGKTLLESMKLYVEQYHSQDGVKVKYNSYASNKYDASFAYRFLIRLRDVSQHGHLVVSYQDGGFCFDLHQILEKPHYHHNAGIKQQVLELIQEIRDVYGDTVRLSLKLTIAEYTASLLEVYREFWRLTKELLHITHKKFRKLLFKRPDHILRLPNDKGCFFAYDCIDDTLHFVAISSDTLTVYRRFKETAEKAADVHMRNFEKLKKTSLFFRIVDKKYIEIGGLG